MHADGSGRHALTNQTNQNTIWTDSAPSFSPDGASVVYSHWTGDAPRLEVISAGGGASRQLPKAPRFVGGPAWSRDGRLAWLEQRGGSRLSLALAYATHVARFPLGSLGPQYGGAGLAWSPDGSRLALTACDRSQICDVWTVSRTGAGLRRMTYGLGAISRLSWAG
jgi:Tol biopolymer transport system component